MILEFYNGNFRCPKCGGINNINMRKMYIYKCSLCLLKINKKSHPIYWNYLTLCNENIDDVMVFLDLINNEAQLVHGYNIIFKDKISEEFYKKVEEYILFI